MKKVLSVAILAGLTIGLTACGGKKKSDDIIAPRIVKVQPQKPIRMQSYDDEKQVEYSLPEVQADEEKPAVEEPPPAEGDLNEEGQTVRIASEGEGMIQIKEIAIHEASKLKGIDGDRVAERSGICNFYAHVNVDDIIVKEGELLFYKKTEFGENGREIYRRIFTPAF